MTDIKKHMAELSKANQIVEQVFDEMKDELEDDFNAITSKVKKRVQVVLMDKLGEYKLENQEEI